ncbi:MAG TPA: TatD family hydrolase [Verrucomicrobiae bacterium]|jgi:TatD DNase family protein|nr:TatD family hydrolase [Verrucomicrobiae bacterium]
MIDTHAHVHDKQFDEDREAVVERARAAGVSAMITVGCDLADSARATDCARRYGLRASVGIHPHEAKDAPDDIAAALDALLDDCVVAIGETGLDYYYDHSPRDAQVRVLRAQIRFARERDLPVIFHHRDAYDDFRAVLREEFAPGMRGVIHCFTGDANQAKTYVDEFDLRLGIGGVLTFKTADGLREAVRAVGLRALILETDCPYLAPIPYRGRRNEPAFMAATAERLSGVLDVSLDEVLAQTDANARALFGATPY